MIVAEEGVQLADAYAVLKKTKKGIIPIMSKAGHICALVAASDIRKEGEFPLATKDSRGSLMVAAAVGTRTQDRDRVRALAAAGVDAIVISSSQGDNSTQHEYIRCIKAEFPKLDVIAGNIVNEKQAKHLIDCGA